MSAVEKHNAVALLGFAAHCGKGHNHIFTRGVAACQRDHVFGLRLHDVTEFDGVLTAALQVVLVAIIIGDADRQHKSARRDGRGYQHKQRQHQDDCDFLSHSINILL